MNDESGLVRWLHLSDFHFSVRAGTAQKEAFEALQSRIEALLAEGHRPDLVFVTGDITMSGKRDEYELAESKLRGMIEKVGLPPATRWFFVPGNHDVDRDAVDEVTAQRFAELIDSDAAERIMGTSDAGNGLLEYYKFTERFCGHERACSVDRPWRAEIVPVGGHEIGILQLNSSWTSHRSDEYGKLVVGGFQVYEALRAVERTDLRIALLHHPLESLHEWDFQDVRQRLARGVQFLLRGHSHQNYFWSISGPDAGYIEAITGAAYTRDKYYTGFNSAKFDIGTKCCTALLFRYGERFWAPDGAIYETTPGGEVIFHLPVAALGSAVHKTHVDPDQSNDAVRTLRRLGRACGREYVDYHVIHERHHVLHWRHRGHDWIEVVTDADELDWNDLTARIPVPPTHLSRIDDSHARVHDEVGDRLKLEEHARRLQTDFEALDLGDSYIELRAEDHAQHQVPADELLWSWLTDPTHVHLTLVGEYGAGKTTVTKKWASELAARYLRDQDQHRAPVRVDLGMAGGERKPEDLVRDVLGVGEVEVTDDLLHLAIEHGLLVLILDGFDEMAERAMESQITEDFRRLAALARGPRAKVLFTCRTSSFESLTSLRRMVRDQRAFRDAILLALSPEDVEAYLGRRVEDATELLRQIRTTYDLADLSERPLLLNMIVLVKDEVLKLDPAARSGAGSYRTRLYRLFTHEWAKRHKDSPAAILSPEERLQVACNMARTMWDENQESLKINSGKMNQALADAVADRESLNFGAAATEVRTATFLVLEGDDRLRFAHKSFLEYFLALDLFRRLQDPSSDARAALPKDRFVSDEVASFLDELIADARSSAVRVRVDDLLHEVPADRRTAALVVSYRLHRAVLTRERQPLSALHERLREAWKDASPLKLPQAILSGVDLRYAYLENADLTGASLEFADLTGACLRRARLRAAKLASVIADEADLSGADLRHAAIDESSLRQTDMSGADLRGSSLRAARLERTTLRRARLDGAHLRDARLKETDLSQATATAADLSYTFLSRLVTDGLDLTGADLSFAAFHAVELEQVRGVPASLRGAALGPGRPTKIELRQPPWRGGGATPSAVDWAPDGNSYAVGSWDGVVRRFDASFGRLLTEYRHPDAVRKIAFSPDSTRLLSACHDGTLRLWNVEREEIVHELRPDHDAGRLMSCAYSGDGMRIAGAWSHLIACVFSSQDGKIVAELRHDRQVRDCEFAAFNGSLLVTACHDGYAHLWDVTRQRALRTFEHGRPLRTCAVSHDYRFVATGGEDDAVRVFERESGDAVANLPHYGWLWSCSFARSAPDRITDDHLITHLITASQDGKARVFEVPSGRLIFERAEGNWVWDGAFSPDDRQIITCGDDGTVRLYRKDDGRLMRTVPHGLWCRACSVSLDSRLLLAACNDRTARLFAADTGKLLHEWEHGSWVRACAFSPNARYAFTVGGDGYPRLFDTQTGDEQPFEDHGTRVRGGAFSPTGELVATGCADGSVRVFNLDRERVRRFELKSEVWTCSFSADGSNLLVGCDDGWVWWLGIEDGSARRLKRGDGWVRATACSPCGRYLAAGNRRGGLWLFDPTTLEELPPLELGPECWSCTFSRDGERLLTAWADSYVRCHETATRHLLTEIKHPGWAWATSFFPGGRRILTGCDDGRLRIYKLPDRRDDEPGSKNPATSLFEESRPLMEVAAAFPVPHGQSPDGYFSLPDGKQYGDCDVVFGVRARYPLSLLSDALNKPALVAAGLKGRIVPDIGCKLAAEFPPVRLPAGWPPP